MKYGWAKRLTVNFAVYVATSLLLELAHRFWWKAHPGSERRFLGWLPWGVAGALIMALVVFMVRWYVREYWHVFMNDSQEEHNGI